MPITRLLFAIFALVSLLACTEVCEIQYPEPSQPDGDQSAPDGDTPFYPIPDGDEPADGDQPVDGDEPIDGDVDLDGDLDTDSSVDGDSVVDGDADGDLDGDTEPEAAPETLPYSMQQTLEWSGRALYTYEVKGDTPEPMVSIRGTADAADAFETKTPMYPPTAISRYEDGTINWSSWVAASYGDHSPNDSLVHIRREYLSGEATQIQFWTFDAPSIANSTLVQAGILPNASTGQSTVNIILVYLRSQDETAALTLQSHRITVNGASLSATALTIPLIIALPDNVSPNTQFRIIQAGNFAWLNAGNSLHRINPDGTIDASLRINYARSDIDYASIIDFDGRVGFGYFCLVSELTTSANKTVMLWTLHEVGMPTVIKREVELDDAGPWRTRINLSASYAILGHANGDAVYFMSLTNISHPVSSTALATWGVPVFVPDPERLAIGIPQSVDDFTTITVEPVFYNLADLVDAATPVAY